MLSVYLLVVAFKYFELEAGALTEVLSHWSYGELYAVWMLWNIAANALQGKGHWVVANLQMDIGLLWYCDCCLWGVVVAELPWYVLLGPMLSELGLLVVIIGVCLVIGGGAFGVGAVLLGMLKSVILARKVWDRVSDRVWDRVWDMIHPAYVLEEDEDDVEEDDDEDNENIPLLDCFDGVGALDTANILAGFERCRSSRSALICRPVYMAEVLE